ncbi:MAG: hypothetical protein PF570_06465 [Candidatus Cloacimonetes bacterium]|jgi:hypothetical protein|nr:hypothetical protein [Candidatus Cloacimonadota bacterium]
MMRYSVILQIVIVLAACQSCASYKTENDIDFMKLSNTGIEIRDDACVLALIQDGILADYYLLSFQQIKLIGLQDIKLYDIEKPLYLKKSGRMYIIELP